MPTSAPTASSNIFMDGFEAGNFSAWSGVSGGSHISVTPSAALVGQQGMQAVINGNTPSYVEDGTPANESSYHARFYFNPHGTTTGGSATYIFTGLDAGGNEIFSVQYRTSGSKYQVRAGLLNRGRQSYTSWYTLSNAAHPIEIAWQSSANASFSLYIDGALASTMNNKNTSSYLVDRVRMGPSGGLGSSTSGSEYYDAFASTRTSYIGP